MKRKHGLCSGSSSKTSGEEAEIDIGLPERLFATGHYPNRRLNVYCKLDILTFVHDVLRDTPEFEIIRESCFGKLFDIPLKHCPVSCKVIHGLLTRQLVTKQRYVLWTVFGGQPIRFSLEEFGSITGLPCGEFPDDYIYDEQPDTEHEVDTYWEELIGKEKGTTIADIGEMLQSQPEMPSGRKLRLALIMIVDGVLVATHQVHRPTLKYVQMVKDVDEFLNFPWGRESFLKTIVCMKPGSLVRSKQTRGKREDPVKFFIKQMQQTTFSLKGFAVVLQMLAYRAVPALLEKMPDWAPSTTLLDFVGVNISKYPILSYLDVVDVEAQPSLVVNSLIPTEKQLDEGWGEWDDEVRDKKVEYMEELIVTEHIFKDSVWPGGDSSEPEAVVPAKRAKVFHKKHVVQRQGKGIKVTAAPEKLSVQKTMGHEKVGCSGRQRRVSGYFRETISSGEQPSKCWIEELKQLKATISDLQALTSKHEKKIKRLQLRRRVKISRHLTSTAPWKRGREDPAVKRSPPCIRLYGLSSPLESSLGGGSESSSEEMDRNCERFYESPILTQQPPSPLHPSPVYEEQRSVPVPDPKVEVGNPETLHHSPKSEYVGGLEGEPSETDHSGSEKERSMDVETVHEHSDQKREELERVIESIVVAEEETEHDMGLEVGEGLDTVHSVPVHEVPVHESFYESPILTQQPPSPLHPSPVAEEQRCVPDPDPKVEVGNPKTLHHSPKNEPYEADHCGSDQQGSSDVETVHEHSDEEREELERVIESIVVAEEETEHEMDLEVGEGVDTVHAVPVHAVPVHAVPVHAGPVQPGIVHEMTGLNKTVHERGDHEYPVQSPSLQQMILYSPNRWTADNRRALYKHEPIVQARSEDKGELYQKTQPGPAEKEVFGEDAVDAELVYVSDSSPAKPRERYSPTDIEHELCKRLLCLPALSENELLPVVDKELFSLFVKALSNSEDVEHVTPAEYTFSNKFLLDLAKPQQWISTLHMEVLVSLMNRRHKEVLEMERAIFVSPWLTNHFQGKYRSFSKAINKDLHHIDDRIAEFVLAPGKTWMKEIHTVYAPMIWDDSHWVGVAINLDMGLIEVFDSQPSLKDAWKVTKLVEPVTHMIPYIISKLCGLKKPQFRGLEPFTWSRVHGVYENLRSGDCGPVAMKFMEIHCNGDPAHCMSVMNDGLVDNFRKQYALDIYKEYVIPCYYPCNCS